MTQRLFIRSVKMRAAICSPQVFLYYSADSVSFLKVIIVYSTVTVSVSTTMSSVAGSSRKVTSTFSLRLRSSFVTLTGAESLQSSPREIPFFVRSRPSAVVFVRVKARLLDQLPMRSQIALAASKEARVDELTVITAECATAVFAENTGSPVVVTIFAPETVNATSCFVMGLQAPFKEAVVPK